MEPFQDLAQLSICEVCLKDVADRCYVRLRLNTCRKCSGWLEINEEVARADEHARAA